MSTSPNRLEGWLRLPLLGLGLSAVMAPATAQTGFDSFVSVHTAALPLPPDSYRSFEPSLAVDPMNPNRVFVGASRRQTGPFRNRDYFWYSDDGARTWRAPEFLMEFAYSGVIDGGGDPVVAAGLSGDFIATTLGTNVFSSVGTRVRGSGLILGRWAGPDATLTHVAEIVLYEVPSPDAEDRPTFSELRELDVGDPSIETRPTVRRASVIPEDVFVDKEWLTVDRSNGPRRGWIYVVWENKIGTPGPAMLAISPDGGRSWETGLLEIVPPQREPRMMQLVSRPSGVLDVVWIDYSRRGLAHTSSSDGGATWTDPLVIRRISGIDFGSGPQYLDRPSLAATADGGLVVCGVEFPNWGSRSNAGLPRETVYCVASPDGQSWHQPVRLDPDSSSTTRLAIPVVAASQRALWVMAYRMDESTTQVVLYRSDDAGSTWEEAAVLTERAFGSDGIRSLVGRADADVGDYMGMAAAGHRLYVAFILPRTDDPGGELNVYVSRLELR